jgi:asparagine synthase (glutamine-hydrolysing)
MLLKFNRDIGAAFGQTARSPFMSHRLVELSLRLPDCDKVRENRGKHVVRELVEDLFPGTPMWRDQKRSYSEIEVAWLGGEPMDRLRAEALQTAREWRGLLEPSRVDRSTAHPTAILRMWRIACFGAWARQFGVEP